MHRKIYLYSTFFLALTAMPSLAQAQNSKQEHCREFTQKIIVDGEEVDGFGTACKNGDDGAWRIISQAKTREAKTIDKAIVKKEPAKKVVILKKKYYKPNHRYAYSHHHDFVDKDYYNYKRVRHHYGHRNFYHGKHRGFSRHHYYKHGHRGRNFTKKFY